MKEDHFSYDPNFRTLGVEEAKLVLELASARAHGTTIHSVRSLIGGGRRANSTVARLIAKGWLQRASRGHYVFLPPEWGSEKVEDYDAYVLASASVDEGYVGWWAAASRHGLTTQVPNVIHVAVTRQTASREMQGTWIKYVKVSSHKFFGWESMPSSSRSFRVSSPVKTVVDCVDRPDLCGGPTELALIVARATANNDDADLVETALRLGSVSTCQRMGFLCDLVAPDYLRTGSRARLRDFIPPSARSVFGAGERKAGDIGYVAEWGLLVNLSKENLIAEAAVEMRGFGR